MVVAVDGAVVIGVLERLGRFAGDLERVVNGELALPAEAVAEALART